jgi:hypothetical protein
MHPSIRKAMQDNAAKRKEREQRRLEENAKVAEQARRSAERDRGA